jgi:hypothetical protein
MSDTLNTIIKAIQDNADKSIDIIEKVDSFYNNAWNKLIIFGSILFAIVGVFVPLVIQWYQKRTLKLSETTLKNDLKKELQNVLFLEIEKKFSDNEKQLKSLNASANAKILFSQAKFSIEKNSYKGALGEIITASFSSLECNDFRTLQELLDFLSKNCLPFLSVEEINDLKTANVCDLNYFLEELTKKDDRAMFQTKIGDLKVMISKLPKTVKQKPNEQAKNEE